MSAEFSAVLTLHMSNFPCCRKSCIHKKRRLTCHERRISPSLLSMLGAEVLSVSSVMVFSRKQRGPFRPELFLSELTGGHSGLDVVVEVVGS